MKALKPSNIVLMLLGAAQILWFPTVNVLVLVITAFGLVTATLLAFRFKAVLPMLFFMFGLLYALLFCQYQLSQQISEPVKTELLVQIDSLPKYTASKVSFIAHSKTDRRKYLLSWYANEGQSPPQLLLDHLYQIEVNLKPPHGMANGVGFDREKWLFRHGIDGIGSIKKISQAKQTHVSFMSTINQWRVSLSKLINQHFDQPRINALLHALSIGDKSHFDQRDLKTYQNTGTAHLIAISGLHIGMVALLGYLLGSLVFKFWPKQHIPKPILQITFGLTFAIFYACLAGLAVSTQRAVIMLAVLGFYKLLRRSSHAWDVWSMSLLMVLLIDPLNVLDGGFWLSFIAVAVLILAFNGQSNHQHKSKSHRLISFVKMQSVLLVGMLPLSLAIFSRVNLIAPVVNLLMIPLMTFLLIPVLLLLLLIGSVLQQFPELLVQIIQFISLGFVHSLDWFNQFSTWALNLTINHWWQYVLIITGAIVLILPPSVPQRFWGLALMLTGFYSPIDKPPTGHFKAHFLDVGQGLSVLVETQHHNLVYDVGSAYDSGFNMADAVLIPYLQSHQLNQLDALVLSHQDNDHSGAAEQFAQQIHVNTTWGTKAIHQACLSNTSWTWDEVKFTFLSPHNLTPYLKNNSSCVLKIESHEISLLLTGDIEEPVEYRLQQLPAETIHADVLLMPHHGSKTSSSTEFIAAVNPSLVINSSGQYNPFNHPAPEIIERYQQLNLPVLDTQSSGLITLTTYPKLNTQQYRNNHPRLWHKKSPNKSGF